MKRELKRVLLMLQFLTIIPIPVQLEVNEEDFGKGLVYAPLVGLILGLIISGIYLVIRPAAGSILGPVIVIISYIMLTGGLHMDGLGDTFDGLFSNRSRERMLEIMRDSRVGTNAVLGIISVILLNIALLSRLPGSIAAEALLLMPAAGRIGSLVGSGISTYARKEQGLGKAFIDICGFREIIIGLLLVSPFFYLMMDVEGILILLAVVISTWFQTWLFSSKIGGMTGDTLGAVCEINQAVFLCLVLLLKG